MLQYFNKKKQAPPDKGKSKEKAPEIVVDETTGKHRVMSDPSTEKRDPILDDEDQAFLEHIVSLEEGPPPPLPERPRSSAGGSAISGASSSRAASRTRQADHQSKDAQTVLMQGADRVPIPSAPDTPKGETANAIEGEAVALALEDKEKEQKKKNRFSWLRRSSSRSTRKADQNSTGALLHDAAQSLKVPESGKKADGTVSGTSTPGGTGSDEEMASVLDQLNLAAENNRVFSMSDESKELMKKFNLVLKDLINGAPTAYHDLESLLTNSDDQIKKFYDSLPPFVQDLVEKLPEKITGPMGSAGAAAATAAATEEADGKESKEKKKGSSKAQYLASGAATASKLLKVKVPSLKELLTKQGSVVTLLRSIVAALRTRFPALMGLNAVWSVALFVLLFIFWYCHKRGREERLARERKLTEEEMEEIRRRVAADPAWQPPEGWNDSHAEEGALVLTTRAPEGASIEEIRAGMLADPESVPPGEAEYAPDGSLGKALQKKSV